MDECSTGEIKDFEENLSTALARLWNPACRDYHYLLLTNFRKLYPKGCCQWQSLNLHHHPLYLQDLLSLIISQLLSQSINSDLMLWKTQTPLLIKWELLIKVPLRIMMHLIQETLFLLQVIMINLHQPTRFWTPNIIKLLVPFYHPQKLQVAMIHFPTSLEKWRMLVTIFHYPMKYWLNKSWPPWLQRIVQCFHIRFQCLRTTTGSRLRVKASGVFSTGSVATKAKDLESIH